MSMSIARKHKAEINCSHKTLNRCSSRIFRPNAHRQQRAVISIGSVPVSVQQATATAGSTFASQPLRSTTMLEKGGTYSILQPPRPRTKSQKSEEEEEVSSKC
eukprot:17594-Amphidinium_carterae.1